jgi:hypothetical protein
MNGMSLHPFLRLVQGLIRVCRSRLERDKADEQTKFQGAVKPGIDLSHDKCDLRLI